MLLCPFCDKELKEENKIEGGWECPCGEFVPEGMAFDTEANKTCKMRKKYTEAEWTEK